MVEQLGLHLADQHPDGAQSDAPFRRAFEDSTIGLAFCAADGRFAQVNRALCGIFGYSESELLRRTLFDVMHVEERERSAADIQQMIVEGRNALQSEQRYMHRNGCIVWALLNVSLLRDTAGAAQLLIAQVRDITEHKRAGEALQFTQSTMDQGADAIYWVGHDGRVLYANQAACRMLNYSREELQSMSLFDFDPEFTAASGQELWTAGQNGAAIVLETTHRTREGRELPVEVTARYITAPDRAVMCAFVRDISERRRVEAALRESEERFRLLFNTLSSGFALHEIICDAAGVPCDYRFLAVNPAFEQMTGLSASSLLGRTVREVLPGIESYWIEAYGRVALTGEAVRLEQTAAALGRHYEVVAYCPMPGQFATIAVDVTARDQAAAALRASECRFEAQYRSLPVPTYTWKYTGDDFELVDYNDAARDNSPDELAGMLNVSAKQFFAENPEVLAMLRRSYSERISVEAELDYRSRATGERRDFLIHMVAMPGDLVLVHTVDITARKRAEAALRESEERFRIMADSALTIMWVTDAQGGNLFVNRTYCEFFGIDTEQAQGRRWHPRHHPDTAAAYRSAFRKAVAEHTSFLAETQVLRADGEWRWIESHAEPRFAAGGEFLGHVGVSLDITERKQGENVRAVLLKALEATSASDRLEEFLEEIRLSLGTLMDTTNFFVALYDTQKQLYQFPCFADQYDQAPSGGCVLPYSLTDHVRRSGQPLLVDAEANTLLRAALNLPRSGTPSQSWLGVPLKTAERIIGVMVVQSYSKGSLYTPRDLELLKLVSGHVALAIERKQALDALLQSEAELRHAQKMDAVGRLAGGVAHDFNNLLTTILGYSELALLTLPTDSALADGVTQIRRAAERAAALTRQLLAFSRKQVLQPRIICLNDVVVDMEKMLRRLIGEDVLLITRLGEEPGTVKADPGQIEQVIMNLVVNARDAMEHGGEVTIETSAFTSGINVRELPPGSYVELAVRDRGSGMNADTLARIFEPFFTTKGPGKGTGLGLSTVYGIVEQSGGHIHVDSQPGKGTTFHIYLPRVDAPPEKLAVMAGPVAADGRETILLVEDESAVRQLARDLLRGRGYNVLEAACGAEALAMSAEAGNQIDLVVTDMIMPGLSGRELAAEMHRRIPGLKMLFISGYTADFTQDCELLRNGKAFLSKPFSANELYQKVRELLDDSGSLESAAAATPASSCSTS